MLASVDEEKSSAERLGALRSEYQGVEGLFADVLEEFHAGLVEDVEQTFHEVFNVGG